MAAPAPTAAPPTLMAATATARRDGSAGSGETGGTGSSSGLAGLSGTAVLSGGNGGNGGKGYDSATDNSLPAGTRGR